jgi:Ca2+-binding RTX toxin-like protein
LTATITGIPDATKGKIYLSNGIEVTNGQRLSADQIPWLMFRPVANANSEAGSFSYTVSDGRLTNSQTINFNINSINDAPSFTMGTSQTVRDGMGELTFKGWVNNFNPGANEANQNVQRYIVEVLSNPSIFKIAPTINTQTGDLTYVQDNGGVANNGVDTSVAQTFTISVLNTTTNSITLNGRWDAETLTGTDFNDLIYAWGGDDTIIGGLGNDQIWGQDGNDTIYGDQLTGITNSSTFSMDDIIYGGFGNDRIFGNAGNDQIWGEDGNDEIWGGLGNDTLRGGFGRDTFVVAVGQGTDSIMDFRLGEDLIAGASGLKFDSLLITQQGRDTLISDRNTNQSLAVLSGINASSLTRNSFVSII